MVRITIGFVVLLLGVLCPQALPAKSMPQIIQDYHAYVEHALEHFPRVPADLVYTLIRQESGGNPEARGAIDEIGLMQIRPATARRVLATLRSACMHSAYDLRNPQHNILIGTAYIDSLLARYEGSLILAALGYNAGEKTADYAYASLKANRTPRLKANTRRYITAIAGVPAVRALLYTEKSAPVLRLARAVAEPSDAASQASSANSPKPAVLAREKYLYVALAARRYNSVSSILRRISEKASYLDPRVQVVSPDFRLTVPKNNASYARIPVGYLVRIEQSLLGGLYPKRQSSMRAVCKDYALSDCEERLKLLNSYSGGTIRIPGWFAKYRIPEPAPPVVRPVQLAYAGFSSSSVPSLPFTAAFLLSCVAFRLMSDIRTPHCCRMVSCQLAATLAAWRAGNMARAKARRTPCSLS